MCLLTETRALSAQGEKRALVGNLTMPHRLVLNRDFHFGRPGRRRYTFNGLPRGPDVFVAHSSGSRHRQRGSHCGRTCPKHPNQRGMQFRPRQPGTSRCYTLRRSNREFGFSSILIDLNVLSFLLNPALVRGFARSMLNEFQ